MGRFDNLRPASFRGVEFHVRSNEMEAGRRVTVHEYPQRDIPWAEDLGRAARSLTFSGFVVGDDYMDKAKRLLTAMEEAGPGTLIHPWLGTLNVTPKEPARISFPGGLGVAEFSLSFTEAGELTFPAASDSTAAQSRKAAENIETAAVKDFGNNFNVTGFHDFVRFEALDKLKNVANMISGGNIPGLKQLGYATAAISAVNSFAALLGDPSALAWRMVGFIGITGQIHQVMRFGSVVRSLVGLAEKIGQSHPAPPKHFTLSRQQAAANESAVNNLARQAVLAQAVGASSLMETTVYDETMELRDALLHALDAASLLASDESYEALQDARGRVSRDLTERARDSSRLITLRPHQTIPALVIAYNQYEDAERDDEIVIRNRIRHPGFVPPEPLRIMAR